MDYHGPTVMSTVQRAAAKSPENLSKIRPAVACVRVQSPASESQQARPDGAGGWKNAADGTVYRSMATTELSLKTSPRISPLPESHRVLTPPITKAGEMPFISDRSFPMPASTDGDGRQRQQTTRVGEVPHPSAAGLPVTSPRSPTGTSKPPPPPRTVSVKSPEVLKSSQSSDSYEVMRSYRESSSSESSKFSHAERFSDKTQSCEYSERFETSKNYHDSQPEDTAKTHTVLVQPVPSPRRVLRGHDTQDFEYPVADPSRREVGRVPGVEVSSSDSVGQSTTVSGTEPAAVDMLFSYHQMTQDTGDGQFSTSSFNSRCSPAVLAQSQPTSSASSRDAVLSTHYYV